MTTHGVERGQSGILGGQRWFLSLLALAATTSLIVGCSGDSSSGSTPTIVTSSTSTAVESTTTTAAVTSSTTTEVQTAAPAESTTTTAAETIESVIADRIRAFFAAREAANAGPVPNPGDPALAEVAIGDALTSTVSETQRRLDDGRAIRGGELQLADIRVGSVQVSDATASAGVCSIDDGVIYEVGTGDVINDDVVTHNYLIELDLVGEAWKVSRVVRLQQWEGVAGCALSPQDFPH